ncbi:hypothetical protein BMJ32_18770 [Sinorhizobium medicae]|uniref:Uncharacterized protein n=1 Tax=Sinorhizobium medicae TaxID=110321 RepID=A0A508WXR9_9HYPH|nr:hypothetical protein [Sinorhizobium medicae]MDX0521177.1 hypothetical protein [Sinorhizobium medicae]MDX0545491.1 hypothetical protein [Sinorhizobium medicae]MDX0632801.1 hypothetical protein [Sinorhizobium medicae]MDX0713223.1 hypothetical protein [Sinorhizobium medicae]
MARRLRVLNFACWASAASWLAVAILHFPDPKLRTIVITVPGLV